MGDVVSHAAEKVRFGHVGPAGLLGGGHQLLPVFQFLLFLPVDLPDHIQHIGHSAALVPLFHDEPGQVPGAAGGVILHGHALRVPQALGQGAGVQKRRICSWCSWATMVVSRTS